LYVVSLFTFSIFAKQPIPNSMRNVITLQKEIKEKLKAIDGRWTNERMLIVDFIVTNEIKEIDPEEIYIKLRTAKRISRGTLYNTIKMLVALGYIEVIPKVYKVKF
jgi:Fe2+ or Zn2+ uptake regulation protein